MILSELADFRVNKTEDICKLGDEMVVKCLGVDKGKVAPPVAQHSKKPRKQLANPKKLQQLKKLKQRLKKKQQQPSSV